MQTSELSGTTWPQLLFKPLVSTKSYPGGMNQPPKQYLQ